MQTKRGSAYTRSRAHPRAHACDSASAGADSCGIMQFAHETYGNARFPCASTKLPTRVFHSSSSFDDSAVTSRRDGRSVRIRRRIRLPAGIADEM